MTPKTFTAYRRLLGGTTRVSWVSCGSDPLGPLIARREVAHELTRASRRRVAELVRLAAAVEAMPGQRASDAAEALWRTIRARDDGWDGARAIQWAERAFREAFLPQDTREHPERLPHWLRPPEMRSLNGWQEVDPRPGCYYVSAICGQTSRRWLVAGPYDTHQEALDLVQYVSHIAYQCDPRAWHLAWGTARTEDPRETILGIVRREPQEATEAPAPSSPTAGRRAPKHDATQTGGRESSGLADREDDPRGRNLRGVWHLPSAPSELRHFAMMPPALAERCLLAGPRRVCSACGAPHAPMVGRRFIRENNGLGPGRDVKHVDAVGRLGRTSGKHTGMRQVFDVLKECPTCECEADDAAPVVLDPFLGAGTTAGVAEALGWRWTGCELSAEYAEIVPRRVEEVAAWWRRREERAAREALRAEVGAAEIRRRADDVFGDGEPVRAVLRPTVRR